MIKMSILMRFSTLFIIFFISLTLQKSEKKSTPKKEKIKNDDYDPSIMKLSSNPDLKLNLDAEVFEKELLSSNYLTFIYVINSANDRSE